MIKDEADHVLLKRGLYYCPNGNGYTGLKCQAGLYPRSYALGLDGVVAVPFADAPEFSPACWEQTKVIHLTQALTAAQADIARLEADNAALRGELAKRNNELHVALATIEQLGENAATAAREYAENMEALRKDVEALRAERDNLAGIVQGWHYLAVGPDEMGDYYTHKQLVKLSEPYASPALRALTDRQP